MSGTAESTVTQRLSSEYFRSYVEDTTVKNLTAGNVDIQDIQSFISGNLGEIIYLRPKDGIIRSPILNQEVFVCETQDDVGKSADGGAKVIAFGDQLCVYNQSSGRWTLSGELPYGVCGYGRICRNTATEKCFFVNEHSFERIGGDDAYVKYMEIRFQQEASGGTPTVKKIKVREVPGGNV